MMEPAFYPEKPQKVELVETHISYVFIAGDMVYKVKKPVDFGFLDFTSLEKRKEFCNQEVVLNRRLAPEAYLGVVPICEDRSGQLALGEGRGRTVEYAVKMIRLPQDRMLKALLYARKAGVADIEAIAAKVADFHAQAATGGEIDEMGKIETVRFNCEENFEQTKKYIGLAVTREKYDFVRDYVSAFMTREKALFEKRILEHRIRDCHGDLHLEHICMVNGIVIFDCIEFNERFRYSDTASEVAFLAMDLDYNGYSEYAKSFVAAYIRASGDHDLIRLLDFYRCYRAYVRAKVISFRLDEPDMTGASRRAVSAAASRYYDLALGYAARPQRPLLILTAGLMGTGKSALAKNLATLLDAKVIRSDVLRKEMLHIAPSERRYEDFGDGIYSERISEETYAQALSMAEERLAGKQNAIIDASYKRRKEREKAKEAASRIGADFVVIECVCPEDEIKSRLDRRAHKTKEPSDGRWEIFQSQKADFEPINGNPEMPELPDRAHIVIDTSSSKEQSLIQALRAIRNASG